MMNNSYNNYDKEINSLLCNNKSINFFNMFCITFEDYCVIIFDLIVILVCAIIFAITYYVRYNYDLKKETTVKTTNNFCLLGQGALSCFYTINNNNNHKTMFNSKSKKNSSVKNLKNVNDKNNNYELKCNYCKKKVELSYSNTINKLIDTN